MDQSARRTIIALAFLALGLLVALLLAISRLRAGGSFGQQSFATEEAREAAVRELVSHGAGIYDSHPDADVGRVLQPGMKERTYIDVPLSTNRMGLREREWSDETREMLLVALLGDSFIFGLGVPAEDRAGVHLERYLNERIGPDGPEVRCAHVGVASWNLQAECAWMRRSLHWLRPELVVQLVLPNDLSDTRGVRGFGSKAHFSPQVRKRAAGMVDTFTRSPELERNYQNHLPLGLDWESRERYGLAAGRLGRLATAIEKGRGQYLLVPRWTNNQPLVRELLAPDLPERQLAYVSDEFVMDKSTWVSDTDFHWNREGNELFAKFLYGVIQQRGLLPQVELPAWDEADAVVERLHGGGEADAASRSKLDERIAQLELERTIRFEALNDRTAKQLYGGADGERVAPYLSVVLPGPGTGVLRVRGERMKSPGLDGVARVWCEEFEVGSISLGGRGPIDASFELPAELAEREFLNVRIESDDYVYELRGNSYCVSFHAESIGIE